MRRLLTALLVFLGAVSSLHAVGFWNEFRNESAAGGIATDVMFSGGTSEREYNAAIGSAPAAGSGNLAVEFIRGSDWGGGVGGILYSSRGGENYYYHYDGRGDVIAQTVSGTDQLTYQAAYDAYGMHLAITQGGALGVTQQGFTTEESGTDLDRFRANTKEEDPNDGLSWQNNRILDLETGGWLSGDPLWFIDGTNRYTDVRDNPWTHFDPEGLATEDDYNNNIAYNQEQEQIQDQQYDSELKNGKIDKATHDEDVQKTAEGYDFYIKQDKAAIENLEETAQYARDHGMKDVTAAQLDDGQHPWMNTQGQDRSDAKQLYNVITAKKDLLLNVVKNLVGMLTPGGAEEEAVTEGASVVTSSLAGSGAKEAEEKGGLVIGKMEDLAKSDGWRAGDHTLNLPPLPDGPGQWEQNERELLNAMSKGQPIREVSPLKGGGFLDKERDVLRSQGWKYDSGTNVWSPP